MDRTPLADSGWCPAMSQSPPSPPSPCQPFDSQVPVFDSQVGFSSQFLGSQTFISSQLFGSPLRSAEADAARGSSNELSATERLVSADGENGHVDDAESCSEEEFVFKEPAGAEPIAQQPSMPGIQVLGGASANAEESETEGEMETVQLEVGTGAKQEEQDAASEDDQDQPVDGPLGHGMQLKASTEDVAMEEEEGEEEDEEMVEKEEVEDEKEDQLEVAHLQLVEFEAVAVPLPQEEKEEHLQLVEVDAVAAPLPKEEQEERKLELDVKGNADMEEAKLEEDEVVELQTDGQDADIEMEDGEEELADFVEEQDEEPESNQICTLEESAALEEPLAADSCSQLVAQDYLCGTQEVISHVSEQLVEMPAEGVVHQQVVASPGAADVVSSLPAGADGEWTASGETCSLNVAGAVMKLPRAVHDRLYKYQRQGVAWMWNLYRKEFGGVLADEMGLGKTVQVAAFLACLKFTGKGSRFLVVVPVTLVQQWRRELESWLEAVDLPVYVLHGTIPERRAALQSFGRTGGVLVTTYDMVRNQVNVIRYSSLTETAILGKKRKRATRGIKDDDSPSEDEAGPGAVQNAANQVPWDVMIVDEAHQVKNPSGAAGKDLRRIDAKSRFLLTGTPLQNKLSDLWAVIDLAQPSLLGNFATFEREFSERIARGSKKNATAYEVEFKDHLARNLKKLTAPHFLRRMKSEVGKSEVSAPTPAASSSARPVADTPTYQELPTKTDVVLWLHLTTAQLELYELYLGTEIMQQAGEGGKHSMDTLRAIGMLKKLSNHPLLMLPKGEFHDWLTSTNCEFKERQPKQLRSLPSADEASAVVEPVSAPSSSSSAPPPAAEAPQAHEASQPVDDDAMHTPEASQVIARLRALIPGSVEGATLLSCKLRVLSLLLPQLHSRGHRCVIFSHHRGMLDLIQNCVLRVLGLKFLRVDGQIDPKTRDLKIQKFQEEDSQYFAMCMSAQVGGVGLTLTGADRVILVDPAWNPAMDNQAIDRIHRIGQQKPVVVYRLIGAGAIEDKMFRLQVFKRGLAKTAFEQEHVLRFFTHKELKSLFQAPSVAESTQNLMAEQLGTEALEHEELLRVVAADVGGTSDPQALAFWQSSDVLGFSDYEKLFMYLEQAQRAETDDVEEKARALTEKLQGEEYKQHQVRNGKYRARDQKENLAPQVECGVVDLVLQDG